MSFTFFALLIFCVVAVYSGWLPLDSVNEAISDTLCQALESAFLKIIM
jgi:hypothetical protein